MLSDVAQPSGEWRYEQNNRRVESGALKLLWSIAFSKKASCSVSSLHWLFDRVVSILPCLFSSTQSSAVRQDNEVLGLAYNPAVPITNIITMTFDGVKIRTYSAGHCWPALLQGLTTDSCLSHHPPTPPDPSAELVPSPYHYKVVSLPMCGTQHLSLLSFIRPPWPILPACTGPFGWQLCLRACWLCLPIWCHLQTWHHFFSSFNLSFE